MWDMSQSCQLNCGEQLAANRRYFTEYDLIKEIPHIYYRNTDRPIVVDKCRSWTLPANQDLIRRFITDNPKTIVLTRPIREIVQSFAALYAKNNKPFDEQELMRENSEPLMRSLRGVEWAKEWNEGEFLFVEYDDLVTQTTAVLQRIYQFLDIPPFDHDLTNIVNCNPEDDNVYGLIGMHDVRPTITLRTEV